MQRKLSEHNHVGRPVRLVSIGFQPNLPLEQIAELVDHEGKRGADIMVLPETFRGQDSGTMETVDGPTVQTFARLARKHRSYIVCPIDRMDDGRRLNSAVILDRAGQIAGVYDKIYPLFESECIKDPPVHPGGDVQVFSADFGKVGVAICFDVNWPDLWRQLANLGAELVVWPSAYSAGRALQAHAINNHYYIATATWTPDCRIYDIDGSELLHHRLNQGETVNVTRVTLDFDRCVFHSDNNYPDKLEKLLRAHGDDVEQEKWLPMEAWFVLKAKRHGVSARELARRYGLEELRDYINRCGVAIDQRRGGAVGSSAD